MVHAPAQLLFGEQLEPALHQVQPRGAGGRELSAIKCTSNSAGTPDSMGWQSGFR